LLPRLYEPEASEPRAVLGVVPHYFDKPKVAAFWRSSAKTRFIDIQQRIERVIDQIVACEYIVSSSLHGLIVAHAYGVPALWVKFADNLLGDGTKFRDYLASVGQTPYDPVRLDYREIDARRLIGMVPDPPPVIDTGPLWAACPFRTGP